MAARSTPPRAQAQAQADGGLRVEQFVDARSTRPRWMRALNAAGRVAPRIARPDASAWWAAARKAVPDAGEPGDDARAALAALVESLRSETRLNLVGRISARDDTTRMARNHLRIARLLREQPAIERVALPPPVFIIGLPRTGTTFLHLLMSQDPLSRTIPYWESFDPIPPAAGPDRRPAKVDAMLKQLAGIAPNYHAIHPMTAEMAEECVALFMNELRTLQFDFQYFAPGYVKWLLHEDARTAYDAYRRQLQIIQHFRPCGERFVLKDPTHIVHLDTLLELFPDAKIIFTHRDPAFSLSSICSLYAHTRAIFSDEVDPIAIGTEVLNGYWPEAVERARTIRARLPASQYADLHQAELARDPIRAVRNLYAQLGFEFDTPVETAMRHFLAAEAEKAQHQHEHRPEGFGQSAEAMRDRLKGYVEEFDL